MSNTFVYWGSHGDGEVLGKGLEVKFKSWFGDKCDFRVVRYFLLNVPLKQSIFYVLYNLKLYMKNKV